MQEVVCEALGALESDVLWQVGQWVDVDQQARQEVVQRLDKIEAQTSFPNARARLEGGGMHITYPSQGTTEQSLNIQAVQVIG